MDLLGGLNKIFSSVSKILGPFSMIASFLPPPFCLIGIAGMVAQVGSALTQKPPDFGAAIMGGLMAALPFGMGKAMSAFGKMGGGTAGTFAKTFADKMKGSLDDIAGKLKLDQLSAATRTKYTELINAAKDKIGRPEFTKDIEAQVLKATGKSPTDHINPAEIEKAAPDLTKTFSSQLQMMAPQLIQQQMVTANRNQMDQSSFTPLTEQQIMAEVNANLAPFQSAASNMPAISARPPVIKG